MNIAVAFASLSGNTLIVATEIQKYLEQLGHTVTLNDLLQTNPDDLKKYDLVFLGSSTYGEGDLNPIAEIFFSTATSLSHVCDQTKFALFSLGDSSYTQFAESGKIMLQKMNEMEASCLSPVLTLDGPPNEEIFTQVRKWVDQILIQTSY